MKHSYLWLAALLSAAALLVTGAAVAHDGPEHEIEFAFVYYYHPVARQFAGAAALGLSFPLDGRE